MTQIAQEVVLRMFAALALSALMLCASCSTTGTGTGSPGERVLFVGNSLLYVGNMPAVYAALSSANGHPVRSDMIVRGGATLSQRVADGTIADALERNQYGALVVQERGGDLLCAFTPQSCAESRQAMQAIAGLAREHDVPVVLLGSYQSLPEASRKLVEAETAAAAEAGIGYVELSETLRRAREHAPDLAWFHADGSHPGKDLTLLAAIRIYRQLHGEWPAAKPLTVNAPIYTTQSGLDAELRAADAPAPLPGARRQVSYPAATTDVLLQAIGD